MTLECYFSMSNQCHMLLCWKCAQYNKQHCTMERHKENKVHMQEDLNNGHGGDPKFFNGKKEKVLVLYLRWMILGIYCKSY
jgi:hypothetical protein